MKNLPNPEIVENIRVLISLYEVYLYNRNQSNLTEFNIECENIFCDVLNQVYELNLHNLNTPGYNYPAIDLGDADNGICFQVTSQNDSDKIKNTIAQFIQNRLSNIYQTLYILILGKKKRYRIPIPNYVEIYDLSMVLSDISRITNKNRLMRISEILNDKFLQYNIPGVRDGFFTSLSPSIKLGINYNSYLKDYMFNDEEKVSMVSDIAYFANILSKLSISTRQVILFAINNRIYQSGWWHHDWNDYIHFYSGTMNLNIDSETLRMAINELYYKGYVSGLDDEENIQHFLFYDEGRNYCILNEIHRYCLATNKNLEPLLLNLDFTILD